LISNRNLSYCGMTSESLNNGARRNRPLFGNGSINKFPRQRTHEATTKELQEALFSMRSMPRLYSESRPGKLVEISWGINTGTWPSRLRESRIWDSKMWSWIPKDSDPRMTALARTSSHCKRQTRPIVRKGTPHQQTRNYLTVTKIWSWAQAGYWHRDRLADWP
jgi:hypothetical protein